MGRSRPRRPGFDVGARIARVLAEHDHFMNSNDDDAERAKRFYARHNAAKAAISHVLALQQIEGSTNEDSDDPTAMVTRARTALAQERARDESEVED